MLEAKDKNYRLRCSNKTIIGKKEDCANLKKELKGALQELIELETQAEKFVKSAPDGKLRCTVNKGCYQ